MIGGPIGDRIGRKRGDLVVDPRRAAVHPGAALCRPVRTAILSVIIGLILASAHPAIIVYAQALIPGRVGMVAGLFFGLAFGVAGIGAAFLGWLADQTSITFVYHVCAFLPAIGLLAAFLPETAKPRGAAKTKAVRAERSPATIRQDQGFDPLDYDFFVQKKPWPRLQHGPRQSQTKARKIGPARLLNSEFLRGSARLRQGLCLWLRCGR